MKALAYSSIFLISLAGCHCSNSKISGPKDGGINCIDFDGDGYGANCASGPDCDDSDPNHNTSCDCNAQPFAGGCSCSSGTPTQVTCPYTGPAGTKNIGDCRAGGRNCISGKWSMDCTGQITPKVETCDNADNDCNGKIDDGITCVLPGSYGPGQQNPLPVPDGSNSNAVTQNPDGTISLSSTQDRNFYAWIANTDEGTVSKIDTETGKEIARYRSVIPGNNSAVAWNAGVCSNGDVNNVANCPSRTALDSFNDVYVANRGFGHQGTVTKIANSACPDKNADGVITTSHDANGDGIIDINSAVEFPGAGDECILWTRNVGTAGVPGSSLGGVPRALAVDSGDEGHPAGFAWVGLWNDQKFSKIDPNTGDTILQVSLAISPYGAAIDKTGNLWATPYGNGGTQLVSHFNIADQPPVASSTTTDNMTGGYGIAVDGRGWVWLGGYPNYFVHLYVPGTTLNNGNWFRYTPPGLSGGQGRGIAADKDGNIYVAISTANKLTKLNVNASNPLAPVISEEWTRSVPGGDPIGVGLDPKGNPWVVSYDAGQAYRYTTAGVNDVTSTAFGAAIAGSKGTTVPHPYTYSDFTGYAQRSFVAARGVYRVDFSPCSGGKVLPVSLDWVATTPANSKVEFFVRVADTQAGLSTASAFGPYSQPGHNGAASDSPVDLTLPPGIPASNFVRVEVVLTSLDHVATPSLTSFHLGHVCPSG